MSRGQARSSGAACGEEGEGGRGGGEGMSERSCSSKDGRSQGSGAKGVAAGWHLFSSFTQSFLCVNPGAPRAGGALGRVAPPDSPCSDGS